MKLGRLEQWAEEIAEYLESDKSNDWSEELAELYEILWLKG